ncbi:MAG: hypothetical protein SGJ00_05580 [bacterium]|nr:hypothetical protein [bacterium]
MSKHKISYYFLVAFLIGLLVHLKLGYSIQNVFYSLALDASIALLLLAYAEQIILVLFFSSMEVIGRVKGSFFSVKDSK